MGRVAALLGLVMFAAACAATPFADRRAEAETAAENAVLVERGSQIAQRLCVTCHAIGESGESRNAQAPPFRILSEQYPGPALEEALSYGVLEGHPAMPEFGFGPDDIEAIAAYLRSVQERQAA